MRNNEFIKRLKITGVDYNTIRRFRYEINMREKYNIPYKISRQNETFLGHSFSLGKPDLKNLLDLTSKGVNPNDYIKKLQRERKTFQKTGRTIEVNEAINTTQRWLSDFAQNKDYVVNESNFVEVHEIYERMLRYEESHMDIEQYVDETARAINDLENIFGY